MVPFNFTDGPPPVSSGYEVVNKGFTPAWHHAYYISSSIIQVGLQRPRKYSKNCYKISTKHIYVYKSSVYNAAHVWKHAIKWCAVRETTVIRHQLLWKHPTKHYSVTKTFYKTLLCYENMLQNTCNKPRNIYKIPTCLENMWQSVELCLKTSCKTRVE